MALPTLSKSWIFNCNNLIAAQGTVVLDNQTLLLAVVNALLATGKWTVFYSCNSVAAGTAGDGVNRWLTPTNLVGNSPGSAHSWIVLKNTNMPGGNYQILIEVPGNITSAGLTFKRSINAGFTGGSTTNAPTSTDQVSFLATAAYGGPSNDQAMRWSVEVSTDGQCTRVIFAAGGALRGLWYLEKTANPDAGTTYPVAEFVGGTNTGSYTPSLTAIQIYPLAGVAGTASVGYVSQLTNLTSPSSINLNWPIVPACAVGTTGAFGYLGMFQDMWVGSASIASGDSYPGAPNWTANTVYALGAQVTNGSNVYTCTTAGTSAASGGPTGTGTGIADNTCVWSFFSATNQFVQVGQYILPWNGGAFNLT